MITLKFFFLLILALVIIFFKNIERRYCDYYINKKFEDFKEIVKKFNLGSLTDKSIKIKKNSIDFDRFAFDIHRSDENNFLKTNVEDFIKYFEYKFVINHILKKKILRNHGGEAYEKMYYFKHPYLPFEKIHLGDPYNGGFVYEKKFNKIIKKIYLLKQKYDLSLLYSDCFINKLKDLFPIKSNNLNCGYKYDEHMQKLLSIYVNNENGQKIENIKNNFIEIVKLYGVSKKNITKLEKKLESLKNNKFNYINFFNEDNEYGITIYYEE